jgi:hypothetical protein
VSRRNWPNSRRGSFSYGGAKILHFYPPLADKHDLGDPGDACHPGIAEQLGIESQQPVRRSQVSPKLLVIPDTAYQDYVEAKECCIVVKGVRSLLDQLSNATANCLHTHAP